MELSNELKVERIRLSLTAKSVAEEMGISRQQLCNIEQSETAPVVVKYIEGIQCFILSPGFNPLNPRPADYKSAALPTELHQRFVKPSVSATYI